METLVAESLKQNESSTPGVWWFPAAGFEGMTVGEGKSAPVGEIAAPGLLLAIEQKKDMR